MRSSTWIARARGLMQAHVANLKAQGVKRRIRNGHYTVMDLAAQDLLDLRPGTLVQNRRCDDQFMVTAVKFYNGEQILRRRPAFVVYMVTQCHQPRTLTVILSRAEFWETFRKES